MPRLVRSSTVRARRLRQDATPAEQRLWAALRNRGLAGIKFRRQCPIGPFFLDFFADELALGVELDGASHDGRQVQDASRERWLRTFGIEVIRFENRDVLRDIGAVCAEILRAARARSR